MLVNGRLATSIAALAAVAVLAACSGGSRSVTSLPQAAPALGAPQSQAFARGAPMQAPGRGVMPPQPSLQHRPAAWLSPEAKTGPVIFVANTGNATVTIYSATAKTKNPPAIGLLSTGLTYPWGMAVDDARNLYVANVHGPAGASGNVVMYHRGARVPSLTYTAGLSAPIGVAVGSDGTVYVANQNVQGAPGNVVVYPPGSTTPSQTLTDPNFTTVWALAVDAGGNVYVAYTGSGPQPTSVDEFLAGTSLPIGLGLAPVGSGYEYYGAVALDATGNLVMGDFYQVEVWPPNATLPSQTFGQRGTPDGAAFSQTGNRLFVSDNNEAEVELYSYPAGNLVNLYTELMKNPEAVAVRPRMPLPVRSPQPPPPTPTPSPTPVPTPTPTNVPAGQITEYQIPTGGAHPIGVTAGPDGALWFAERNANQIGQITTAGQFTEYPIPTNGAGPYGIVAGPDGALWFAEFFAGNIGRITTAGNAEYPIPTGGAHPVGIAAGPDGALWFTEYSGNNIGQITTSGQITEYPIPTSNAQPIGIAVGPDGALWFAEVAGNNIGRITTAGQITEYPIPTGGAGPYGIVAGSDGALWFTEENANNVGRIATTGQITEYPIPTGNAVPAYIAAGPDGALWFTEYSGNNIGQITTAGQITEYAIPTGGADPFGIAAGSDGALWFTEFNGNNIGRITTGLTPNLRRAIHRTDRRRQPTVYDGRLGFDRPSERNAAPRGLLGASSPAAIVNPR